MKLFSIIIPCYNSEKYMKYDNVLPNHTFYVDNLNEILDIENFQGNAVVNYTDKKTPDTPIIEHKHFEFGNEILI